MLLTTMESGDIAFPGLSIYIKNLPKGFDIFGFHIAFYGVIIGIAILVGLFFVIKEGKRVGHPDDLWWDFAVYEILFSIICARIYYVVFSFDLYKNDWKSIFNLRQGGLAIYGAVIGGFLGMFLYSRWKKQSFYSMGDVAVFGLLAGQIIGRYGNFMNREAFGGYSDGLLRMRLPIDAVRFGEISESIMNNIVEGTNYIQVHPTFLYESLLNLCLFLLLWIYRKHKLFDGELTLGYLGGYGIIRFIVEGLRTDQLQWGDTGIAVSQILGLLLFIFSIIADVVVRRYRKHKI